MRLQILENGHRPFQKVILSFIRTVSGGHVAGPVLDGRLARLSSGNEFKDHRHRYEHPSWSY